MRGVAIDVNEAGIPYVVNSLGDVYENTGTWVKTSYTDILDISIQNKKIIGIDLNTDQSIILND